RFAANVAAEGSRVHAICNATMDRLIARVPGVTSVVSEDADIPDDAVLASVPEFVAEYVEASSSGRSQTAPLWSGPYLSADPSTAAKWAQRLPQTRCFQVGVTWGGTPGQANDDRRSFDAVRFAPLAALPGVQLISLQHGHRDQLVNANCQLRSPIVSLGDEYQAGDWLDTAGLIANLDLV